MKKILNIWKTGWKWLLIGDDIISFSDYFSLIFAEIAYLFANQTDIAIPFTILLGLCIANVCICSFIKGFNEGEKLELIPSRAYVIIFVILFVIGCFINLKANIILMLLPLVGTAILVFFNDNDIFDYLKYNLEKGGFPPSKFISYFCKIGSIILQLATVFVPSLIFAIMLFKTVLPTYMSIGIFTLYVIMMPFFTLMEDDFAACNIFEIAYQIYYDPNEPSWSDYIN